MVVGKKKPFTQILFREGRISTLYGIPESGKTNLMVFLSQCAAKYNYHVWTVIQFFEQNEIKEAISEGLLPDGVKYIRVPPNINTVKKVSDLLLGLLEFKDNATILDEAGVFASTRAPMAKKLRWILSLSYIIRHLRSSFVYVTQTEQSIPPEMKAALVSYEMTIRRVKSKYHTLEIKKRIEGRNRYGKEYVDFRPVDFIGRIPLTNLPWDGHYIPKFEFDLDLDKCWNELGEYGSLKVRKHARDIIIGLRDEFKENKNETRQKDASERREEAYNYVEQLVSEGVTRKNEIAYLLAEKFNKSLGWAYLLLRGLDPGRSK